jgi:Common central domain of tyrosinase
MKLPSPIFESVKSAFAHHGCWHSLRVFGTNADLARCFPQGAMLPNVPRLVPNCGCGEDFLRFHRLMIRNFKWIIDNSPLPKYRYASWTDFPDWLSPLIDGVTSATYRQELAGTLNSMISNSNLDALGQFIEGEKNDGPHIHYIVHELVHDYEESHYGPQTESDMGVPALSPCNEHFWAFHGWIDDIYARWQTAHGESPNRTSLKPMLKMDMCAECMNDSPLGTGNPWLVQWQTYLESRAL